MSLEAPELRASQFNIVVETANGDFKVANTLWRSAVQLDSPAIAGLLEPKNRATTQAASAEIQELAHLGMLVPVCNDEFEAYEQLFKKWARGGTLTITYAPTMRCNFTCEYCVQSGNFQGEHRNATASATDQNVDEVVVWIERLAISGGHQQLAVNLFGGEPLLEPARLLRLMNALNGFCADRGISVCYQLVSNGALASASVLGSLARAGLTEMQVTIDGLRHTHNRRRSGGRNTYDVIWTNIADACQHAINVRILTVVDQNNVDDLLPHIDYAKNYMEEQGIDSSKWLLQFGDILETSNTIERTERLSRDFLDIIKKRFAAYAYAQSLGLRINDSFGVNLCNRESENSILIGPQGDLYKCYSTIGDARYSVGHVSNSSSLDGAPLNVARIRPFLERPECRSCDIVPYCRAGCQFAASLYNGGEFGRGYICNYDRLKLEITTMMELQLI